MSTCSQETIVPERFNTELIKDPIKTYRTTSTMLTVFFLRRQPMNDNLTIVMRRSTDHLQNECGLSAVLPVSGWGKWGRGLVSASPKPSAEKNKYFTAERIKGCSTKAGVTAATAIRSVRSKRVALWDLKESACSFSACTALERVR